MRALPGPTGPSDPGLAGERTSLAWSRMGMSLLAIPSALLALATRHSLLAGLAAAVACVLGLALLTLSVRRHRATPEMIEERSVVPAAQQVLLTGACVLVLCLAGLLLVLD